MILLLASCTYNNSAQEDIAEIQVSHNGTTLLINRFRNGHFSIHSAEIDGSNETEIAATGLKPRFSYDDALIAATNYETGQDQNILTMKGDGTSSELTVETYTFTANHVFSPIENSLIFQVSDKNGNELIFYNLTNNESRTIHSGGKYNDYAFSPDGHKVVFDNGRSQLLIHDLTDGTESTIPTTAATVSMARFKTANEILYSGDDDFIIHDLNTQTTTTLVAVGSYISEFAVSSTGDKIAFITRAGQFNQIKTYDLNHNSLTQITNDDSDKRSLVISSADDTYFFISWGVFEGNQATSVVESMGSSGENRRVIIER